MLESQNIRYHSQCLGSSLDELTILGREKSQSIESQYTDQTKIYTETRMFDYLFPTNYRSQLREKLADLVQGNKTILKYMHELEELLIIISNISDRNKVLKYWNGVRQDIRSAL